MVGLSSGCLRRSSTAERQADVHLAYEGRFEGHCLELDDDVPAEVQVIEEQIQVEVLITDLELNLPAHECEPGTKLQEEPLDVVD